MNARRLLAIAVLGAWLVPCAGAAAAPQATARVTLAKPAAVPAAAATPAAEWWKRARSLADQRRFDEAIETVGSGLREHPGSTELLWLEAGLFGEAGRHAESVVRYERLMTLHPQMARDLRADLATQRLWADDPAGALRDFDLRIEENPSDRDARRLRARALAHLDRHAEALAAYDQLLAGDPDDREALLGRARVLAWMGRHAQATAAYHAYLANHPADPDARLALAQNVNWSGDHRRAARMFEELRRDGSTDPEVVKGLAWAEYWAGRPEPARVALGAYLEKRPGDREGAELARLLARDRAPSLTFGIERSDDSDGLRVTSGTAEYRQPFGAASAATLFYRRDALEDPVAALEPFQLGAALEHRWSDRWSGRFMAAYLKPDGGEATGVGEASVTFRPDERWRFDAGVDRSLVLTRVAQSFGVLVRTLTVGADWNATNRVMLHADQRLRFYSDDNRGATRAASVRAVAFTNRKVELGVGAGVDHLTTEDDLDHGYYDPEWYTEFGPRADFEWRPRELWTFGAEGRIGRQHEQGSDSEAFHTWVATARLPLGTAALHLVGGRSNSNLSSQSGYRQERWAAYLSFGF